MVSLENKNIIKLFFYLLMLKMVNGYFFSFLSVNVFKYEIPSFEGSSKNEFLFFAVVLAPIFETLIFQLFLYNLLIRIGIKNEIIIILLLSFAFSQAHWYNWIYVFATFIGGLFLNYFFIYVLKAKNELIAVLLTIALHSTYNLSAFLSR